MRIKLDENIPARPTSILGRVGHEVDTVKSEGLAGRDDVTIWEKAQGTGRFLITQDLDFSDVRRYAPGGHEGLLLVRLSDQGRNALLQRIQTVFESEEVESWKGCFVVVTDRKVRIRRKT
jgi:predicted nuclease of predicted toxin-antitoxin system